MFLHTDCLEIVQFDMCLPILNEIIYFMADSEGQSKVFRKCHRLASNWLTLSKYFNNVYL